MTRMVQLAGWLAAVNAVAITAVLGLGITGDGIAATTRSFVGWCGLG
ncbi:MAG: hypothetical protein WD942_09180 [Dehalococcoidia bacterium]